MKLTINIDPAVFCVPQLHVMYSTHFQAPGAFRYEKGYHTLGWL